MIYDVIIIGAGVCGSATARELSKYQVNICVIDKNQDICEGTSKANTGIAHAGFDCKPETLKAEMNLKGSLMLQELSEVLDFPLLNNGAFVIARTKADIVKLQKLYDQGTKNGVKGLEIISGEEARQKEPKLSEEIIAALYAKTSSIVCPFTLNIALAENAVENGVEFKLDTEIVNIYKEKTLTAIGNKKIKNQLDEAALNLEKEEGVWIVETTKGNFISKSIVNSAGIYADVFNNMVSEEKINITPRKGEYLLLDKVVKNHITHTIFQVPTKFGKGVLVTPSTHGNLILGPTANNIEDKENIRTTKEKLDEIVNKTKQSVKEIPYDKIIVSFAGLRAHEDNKDFIIGEVKDAPGFINCAGIASPGLTSAPAIGAKVREVLVKKLRLKEKERFISKRKGIIRPDSLTESEYSRLIQFKPEYANVICRCEQITEGEIIDAIHRPLGARTLDGIKRRTRASSGRCQGGFCNPKLMEILARELGLSLSDISKKGRRSKMVTKKNKE